MYISKLIKLKDIDSWKPGENILIHAPTGSGKSYFIFTRLANYYKHRNLKILIFSNREILRQQNQKLAKTNIDCFNYQYLEKMSKDALYEFLSRYDVIDFDECHYFFKDSEFNKNTDNILEYAKAATNQIKLFASATPEPLFLSGLKFHHTYSLPSNFKFIKEIIFYEDIEDILPEIVADEKKSLCFFSSTKQALAFVFRESPKASFVCSKENDNWHFADKQVWKDIVNESHFSPKILATTTVLDNGISIKDAEVKNIVIDHCDPITIIQSLGRKRRSRNEQLRLYLKTPNQRALKEWKKTKKTKPTMSNKLYAHFKQRLL